MRKGSVVRVLVFAAMLGALAVTTGCGGRATGPGEVVVYTSVDQVFAEPVFRDLEQRTGIRVRAVYDAEAAKTTGLVNRLIAEKARPRADVWWSGEIVQTLKLAEAGVLAPYVSPSASAIPANLKDGSGLWTGFGGRARVLLVGGGYNGRAPSSLRDLAALREDDAARVAMSNPVFGTAATQAAVLYTLWDPETANEYYRAVEEAGVRIVEGNGDVRDRVVSGELDWGLTDTDDALSAIEKDPAIRIVVPDQAEGDIGAILIPNSVGLVEGGPNGANARRVLDDLLSEASERRMVLSGWIQFPVRGEPDPRVSSSAVRFADVDWPKAFEQLGSSAGHMRELFLR